MGAETATSLAAPSGPYSDVDALRSRRLHRIGRIIDLYEELEHALSRMDERELAGVAARTQLDERPLAFWARRIARDRGVVPLVRIVSAPLGGGRRAHRFAATGSFVWEAVAFAVGFAVSLLFIVGGA